MGEGAQISIRGEGILQLTGRYRFHKERVEPTLETLASENYKKKKINRLGKKRRNCLSLLNKKEKGEMHLWGHSGGLRRMAKKGGRVPMVYIFRKGKLWSNLRRGGRISR